jgi:hypothetical protein
MEARPRLVQYTALGRGQIRIIHLLSGSGPDTIVCMLKTVDLDSSPTYEALSYEWGPPEIDGLIIILDGDFIIVRETSG